MTRAEDTSRERWAAVVAAEARGEPVRSSDAEHRRRFEQGSPEAASDEAWLWAGIGALGGPRAEEGELSDAELVERVLAQAGSRVEPVPRAPLAAPAPLTARRRPLARRGVAAALAAAALAAALAALAAELLSSGAPPSVRGAAAAPSAVASASARAGATGAREASPPEAPRPPTPTSDTDDAPRLTSGEAPGAQPDEDRGGARGIASREGKAGEAKMPAGSPRVSGESADALLKRAQTLLGDGRTADAVEAYELLLSRYPSSAEARAALVSLGRLSLGALRAGEALGYFDRYLAGPPGPLTVEARYGRIQALRRLGRSADELSAIQQFLSAHGDSVYAPRLRERLEGAAKERPADPPADSSEIK